MKAVWARKKRLNIHLRGPKKGHTCKHGRKKDGYCKKKGSLGKNKAAMRIQRLFKKIREARREANYKKYAAARGF